MPLLRIDVRGTGMREAFRDGLEAYLPTIGARGLQAEGGVTAVSLDNLLEIDEVLRPGRLVRIYVRPSGVLFQYHRDSRERSCEGESEDEDTRYYATGFAFGYRGEGPSGFARYLTVSRVAPFQNFHEILDRIASIPAGSIGALWSATDAHRWRIPPSPIGFPRRPQPTRRPPRQSADEPETPFGAALRDEISRRRRGRL